MRQGICSHSIDLVIPDIIYIHHRKGSYIEAWKKWPTFCTQSFQMHFLKEISMAYKTVGTPVLMHWSYNSLVLSHLNLPFKSGRFLSPTDTKKESISMCMMTLWGLPVPLVGCDGNSPATSLFLNASSPGNCGLGCVCSLFTYALHSAPHVERWWRRELV